MQLILDKKLEKIYRSVSQRARVLTEHWVDESVFCPNCGQMKINKFSNNRPVADFFCSNCDEEYELKSKKERIGKKIVDGAYSTMIERLRSRNNPNFFLLHYNLQNYEVINFLVIPKHFFIPEIIEKRKPLSSSAKRAGWLGCNILLESIPKSGRIFFVKDRQARAKRKVLNDWQKTLFLREAKKSELKGWILDVMRCIDMLNKTEFSLQEMYNFEKFLSRKHLANRHVKAKIRQQLQFLRDKGYLRFLGNGKYQIV